jgi:small subunit ribosomal protein S20
MGGASCATLMAKPDGKKQKLHSGRHASAIKRARQNLKRRRYNRSYLKEMRAAIKAVRTAIAGKDAKGASTALISAIPIVAKTAGRGIIPSHRGSRFVSRLTKAVNQLQ